MRQEILAGLLSGEGDPVELAAMMPDATSGAGAGSYAAAMTALTEIEGKQLAFASEAARSEEHTSELQSLMRISYAVFCLKKKNQEKIDNKLTNYMNKARNLKDTREYRINQ